MRQVRRGQDRGRGRHGWLDSLHSFSFAGYYDPEHRGFGPLRVINEDRVMPGQGFGTHGHRDMEILSYVLEGALAHRDSIGNGSVLRPGDVQRMSAGTGITHSEHNASDREALHFLQIWIEPNARGLAPGYEEKHFGPEEKRGRWCLIASPDGRDGSTTLHQDARVYAALLDGPGALDFPLGPGRSAYVHVVRGDIAVNGERLAGGDALKVTQEDHVRMERARDAEVLLFDLVSNDKE